MDFKQIDILLQMEELICEREGMIAENKFREHCGNSIAYGEDNFQILAQKFESLRAELRK